MNKWGGAWGVEHLTQFGSGVGSDNMRYMSDVVRCGAHAAAAADSGGVRSPWCMVGDSQAQRHGPVLRSHDKFGNQVSQVEFHPMYHDLMSFGINNEVCGARCAW